ncbi:MAG: cache domain-containing protein, partial [Candidatus Omnitrophica bacterium]|nr:cache domain-containing protein [Candidatus Omnitrophota bacterium]
MKIVNKITLLFLLVATMITVVSTGSFYFVAKNQLRDLIYMQLETTINSRMHHIETYLDMLELAVAQLSKSIVLENFLKGIKDGSRKKEAFEIAMKRLKNTKEVNPYVYEFLLLDAKGKIVAATLENDIGLDKSDDAFFVGAQKHTYIKDAYFSEALKIPLIATSAPIFNSLTGEFLGVVVSRIKLDALSKIVTDSTGLGRTGELYIVNKYGYIFTPSRFSEETFLKKKIDSLNLDNCRRYKNRENALEIEKRTGIFADYRGTEVLGTNRYIPKMQWSVLAEIDTNEVFAPLKKITILFTVVLLLVLLSFWLMS